MRKDIETIIREEPMLLTRPGWTYHPPTLDENGKLKLGFPNHEAFIEINKRFFDVGVRVFLSNLPVGWIDEDTYLFDSMDETMEKLFSAIPDALYIPRLRRTRLSNGWRSIPKRFVYLKTVPVRRKKLPDWFGRGV